MKSNKNPNQILLIIVVVFLIFNLGCNNGINISGRIISSATNSGINGIEVQLRDESGFVLETVFTSSSGTYRFKGVNGTSYYVVPVTDSYSCIPSQFFIDNLQEPQNLYDIIATPVTGTLIPMRDGVKLATDIYMPIDYGSGQYPVILFRTPYGKENVKTTAETWSKDEEVVVMVQDTRGQGQSQGFDMVFQTDGWGELQDGKDTIDWIKSQPWSNGRVAMQGGSALAIVANLLDGTEVGSGLVFKWLIAAPLSLYESFFYSGGGAFKKELTENWVEWQFLTRYGEKGYNDTLNLIKKHYIKDEYWENVDLGTRKSFLDTPAYHLGGWFDIFMPGIIDSYNLHVEAGAPDQHIIIGPWTHCDILKQKQNELTFPENALMYPEVVGGDPAWIAFIAYLKDTGTVAPYPAVTYYVIGDCSDPDAPGNEWKQSTLFPPQDAKQINLFLNSSGTLSPETQDVSIIDYTFKTENPLPTKCGQTLLTNPGPCNISSYRDRSDVLFFSTEPFTEPTEITGAVKLALKAKVDKLDTDFVAFLVDIYPDDKHYLMIEGSQKARFRHGLAEEFLLNKNEWYSIDVDLGYISLMLNTGHRLGLYISNTNYPKYSLPSGTENYWDESLYEAQVEVDLSSSFLSLDVIGSWNGNVLFQNE